MAALAEKLSVILDLTKCEFSQFRGLRGQLISPFFSNGGAWPGRFYHVIDRSGRIGLAPGKRTVKVTAHKAVFTLSYMYGV